MTEQPQYLRDGAAIYRQSFAIIRAETDLSRFAEDEADVVVRMVHACGSTEAAQFHNAPAAHDVHQGDDGGLVHNHEWAVAASELT